MAGGLGGQCVQSHLARHDDNKAALLEVVRGEGVVVLENLAGEDDLEAAGVVRLSLVGLNRLLQLDDLRWREKWRVRRRRENSEKKRKKRQSSVGFSY